MPVITRQFFAHEKGNHDETWYYLARDTDTGEVFIKHQWSARADQGSERIELADFLAKDQSSAKIKLLKLIGTLIQE